MDLKLTQKEHDLLLELLENDLSDLKMEIAATEEAPYQSALRERRELLRDIIARLQKKTAAAA